ncbi:hypothetical protein PV08_06819 [Exophiala spinifera]|uniref:RRM domain-containing protein n=1 Tax=Exophiala spinifera TaxID=91928 RepID=A0A0D2B583_9EURO|nr:uncharacterized protein PV08_06819 [Exophiala spinifera]KIW14038.1 hypothetical protein PV08_06819 [Exophiala spinifera]
MFIGGLNWETTDQSLHDYFSQFGEVQECTVMRDSATGRSRGFGFLTFKDPKTVNTVMVKEHFLDGKIVRFIPKSPKGGQEKPGSPCQKIPPKDRRLRSPFQIDPKRAIPRDEQEKTAKIFVGGVSQDATEEDFESFFAQFGRVVDATLMMDKDTGRPRGFGFVTFDSDTAVEKCLEYQPLEILGKPIEVKRAQPRGKMGEDDDFSRRGRGKFGRDDRFGGNDGNNASQPSQSAAPNMMGNNSGMTPQMMAQYWQRMQQYFAMMQQQMVTNMMGNMGNMGNMGMNQMNPQMMQQMMQMQKMQGGNSPNSQNSNMNMQGMTPQMMQQMMQMQQQQQQGGMNPMQMGGGNRPPMGPSSMGAGGQRGSFSAQEQLAFEQQKYEHQSNRRGGGGYPQGPRNQNFQGGGPQSWEGMYDDVPQPDAGRNSAGPVRGHTPKPPKGPAGGGVGQPSAPANAPTGPKNPGKPGGGFRGGRGRYHPYGR